jgi:bifunctional DNA-binding transcriptional regulator/antitoxin component of YhaV-PrlF toxin-antitoxin module
MPAPKGFSEDQHPFQSARERLRSVASIGLKVDNAGRVVIPAEMRAAMMLDADGRVTATVVDGELRVISPMAAVRQLQGRTASLVPPGTLVSDELIAERRAEAEKHG